MGDVKIAHEVPLDQIKDYKRISFSKDTKQGFHKENTNLEVRKNYIYFTNADSVRNPTEPRYMGELIDIGELNDSNVSVHSDRTIPLTFERRTRKNIESEPFNFYDKNKPLFIETDKDGKPLRENNEGNSNKYIKEQQQTQEKKKNDFSLENVQENDTLTHFKNYLNDKNYTEMKLYSYDSYTNGIKDQAWVTNEKHNINKIINILLREKVKNLVCYVFDENGNFKNKKTFELKRAKIENEEDIFGPNINAELINLANDTVLLIYDSALYEKVKFSEENPKSTQGGKRKSRKSRKSKKTKKAKKSRKKKTRKRNRKIRRH